MGPHFLDVDEGIEAAKVEHRPVDARADRPDRAVDTRRRAGTPDCSLPPEAGG
jgi:hypothetical protein